MSTFPLAATSAPPAGGAALGQVIAVSAAASVLICVLLVLGLGHRSGRITLLGRVADWAGEIGGLPNWAALSSALAGGALLSAVFGLYWDISLHIDRGRYPGPLANPAHYFILAGLFGIFSAGWLAVVLPRRRPGPAAVTITRDWQAPVSGVMLMACASFALLGFPLDDIWHRLFGQDVTLWGPTHLMMLSGAAMSLIGIMGLLSEARLARRAAPEAVRRPGREWGPFTRERVRALELIAGCGGLLAGVSIYQGEFDFGVPQYRLLFHPLLLALGASFALVVARVLAGRGAALGAAVFFIVLRGGLALIVGPLFGEVTPHLPLYLVEALLVEGVALAVGTTRAYRFGMLAGVACATVGLLAEWAWSQLWMPIPWPAQILPEAVALALPAAIAGGVLGAFVGGALALRAEVAATPRARRAAIANLLVIAAAIAYLVPTTVPAGARAQVALAEVAPAPTRTVQATVRVSPPDVANGADWLDATAWQGRGKLVVDPLRRVGDGVYMTTRPLPVFGKWKTAIRLARGSVMASVPVYLPEDAAIPAPLVAATASFQRAFVADHFIFQRERKRNVPGWLWGTAATVVLVCCMLLLAMLGWGLSRLAGGAEPWPKAGEARVRLRRERPAGAATGVA
jgi:hypothetical protein